MADAARAVSLIFRPGDLPAATDGLGDTLARHLVGSRLRAGSCVALPGWPVMTVESVDPAGGEIREGTEVEITVPPRRGDGPLSLAILVDASLTMGAGGSPTPYDRAAPLVDAFLMNGRSFLGSAGIVVQGGEPRHVEALADPESLAGALIHRVEPKGVCDLRVGLDTALEVMAEAEEGPRAILLVTDGDLDLTDPLSPALDVARAGTHLFAVADRLGTPLADACRHTGGQASSDPQTVFEALADLAGARGAWLPPRSPASVDADASFETVIESVESEEASLATDDREETPR